MLINLNKPRKKYFNYPTTHEILAQYVDKKAINIDHIIKLEAEGGNIKTLGTIIEHVDSIIKKHNPIKPSWSDIVDLLETRDDELIILPLNCRIPDKKARMMLAQPDAYINLNSIKVMRALGIPSKGRLSLKQKKEFKWNPEDAFSAATNTASINNNVFGWMWYGKDGHRHKLPFYVSEDGHVLRVIQNLAALKFKPAEYKRMMKIHKSDFKTYEKKLDRLKKTIDVLGVKNLLPKLKLTKKDIIQINKEFYVENRQGHAYASSRSKNKTYEIYMKSLPIVVDKTDAYTLWTEMEGNTNYADTFFKENRYGKGQTKEHIIFPQFIAACRGIEQKLRNELANIPFLPFFIPNAKTNELIDKLRYNTVVLDYNFPKKVSLRALNKAELSFLAMKIIIDQGYENSGSTNVRKLYEEGDYYYKYLVRFKDGT